MSAADLLRFASAALVRQRVRTLLSLGGIAVGVLAVVVLASFGEGVKGYVVGQFAFLGSDLLVVLPGKTETTGSIPGFGGVPNDLTLEDAAALVQRLPEVEKVAPVTVGNETVSYENRSRQCMVMGTTHEMRDVRELFLTAGEFLPPGDLRRGSPVAVVGAQVARELFGGEHPVGKPIRIGDWRFRVHGVIEARGAHLGVDLDDAVLVPVQTALQMFNKTSLFRVLVKLRPGASLEAGEREVLALLEDRHGEEDVTVLTPDSVAGALASILDMLTLAVAAIAGISLVVAGFGVMNVMLVSVTERTGEIGLLKATGARSRQIVAVFLTEAVLLAGAGGAVGVALGLAVVRGVHWALPVFPIATPQWAVPAVLSVALLVGLVFGSWPARRAARLDPVAALRRSRRV